MIVQNVATDGATEVGFTVAKGDLAATLRAAEAAAREIGAKGVTHDAEVSKVSVVGPGMRTHTGVATAMFAALAEAGVNMKMITTGDIKITVLVDRASAVTALRAVHKAFQLDEVHARPQPAFSPASSTTRAMKLVPLADPEAAEPREQGMEDLVIAGVELDETQGRITLFDVPDRPGYAAKIFRAIAEAGVFVDMIVQNVSLDGSSVLSFTVPRDAVDRAAAAVRPIAGGQVVDRADAGQALGHRRGHADSHRRRHPHVRRAGRPIDQHQPDQHQRDPHQRRHRRRQGPRGARLPQESLRSERRQLRREVMATDSVEFGISHR